MYTEKSASIIKVIQGYFDGIFYGDVEKLKENFSNNAHLYGDVKGIEYLKPLDEYLEGVRNRKSPNDLGEKFNMKIIGLEILGNVAIVKLHVPMLGFNYYDLLSLSLVEGEWKIVNKLFTHVEQD